MIESRFIRVLFTYNKTEIFLDGAENRGFTCEIFQKFEAFLYKNLKKKGATQRHLRTKIIYVPVSREQLLPYLMNGEKTSGPTIWGRGPQIDQKTAKLLFRECPPVYSRMTNGFL